MHISIYKDEKGKTQVSISANTCPQEDGFSDNLAGTVAAWKEVNKLLEEEDKP